MLSKTSSYIVKLFKDNEWHDKIINIISRSLYLSDISKYEISDIIMKYLKEKNSDKKIIEDLRKQIKNPQNQYKPDINIKKGFKLWNIIKPLISNTHINAILDFGGGVGDMAYTIGRKILKLPKNKTYVIDVNEFGGVKYIPRNDITFIHFDNIDNLNIKVDIIIMRHVLHHIDDKLYPRILNLINKILSNDGILVLYEHDCYHKNMSIIIDVEHCIFDVVASQQLTYSEFTKDFYAKYLSISKWEKLFNQYFKPIKLIELKNTDSSFYLFFKHINNNL